MAKETKQVQKQKKQRTAKPELSGFSFFSIPLGWIIVGVMFLYLIGSIALYMNNGQIRSYQVMFGTLSKNETYTGLALRTESVVYSTSGGYVNYYAREGNKINADGIVYSVSSSQSTGGEVSLSKEEMNRIRSQMNSFSTNFNPSNFNATYGFKSQLEGNILQYAGDRSSSQKGNPVFGAQMVCRSPVEGLIFYSQDGYEGKTLSLLTEQDFNQTAYQERDLKTREMIQAGDPVYTIVTEEEWDLVVPVTERQSMALLDRSSIRVKFLKDGLTQSGDMELISIEGKRYAHIRFNKGMLRYASERFLEVELVANTESGLRIPRSAMLEKSFSVVPAEFAIFTADNKTGFMKLSYSRGKEEQVFCEATIYGSDPREEVEAGQIVRYQYYLDQNLFEIGDTLINPDNGQSYTISSSKTLDGVYCINKGYAVFCRVVVKEKNEEYAIVHDDTDYGLVRYDRIAMDCSNVNAEDILF